MPQGPVLVLGAGATRACNGPLTNEILFLADQASSNIEREGYVALLDCFLEDVFHLPPRPYRTKTSYPGLPLLMSLIDTAIDRGQPLRRGYDVNKLRDVRAALDYVIFAVLEYTLRGQVPAIHNVAVYHLFPVPSDARVISLNYDIIIDNVLATRVDPLFPDYCCDIQTTVYRDRPKSGTLLKLHGSLNWLYCPNCHRLDVAVSRSGIFSKALEELFIADGGINNDLDHRYTCRGSGCPNCGTFVRPVMITPTQKKDYRNPHIGRIWLKAEEMLREATSVVFVGYSMPPDDVEVVYLFKRALEHLPAQEITVVEFDDQNRKVEDHEVGQRYQSVFGPGIQWHTCGFSGWVQEQQLGQPRCALAAHG
jgi:hypothetical protein